MASSGDGGGANASATESSQNDGYDPLKIQEEGQNLMTQDGSTPIMLNLASEI